MKPKIKTTQIYDEVFRRQIIAEYLQGGITKRELNRKYGISQHSAILEWMRKLGYPDVIRKPKKKIKFERVPIILSMPGEDKSNQELQKEIRDLKRQLEDEKLRAEAYFRIIEKAEQELKISLKKKFNTK